MRRERIFPEARRNSVQRSATKQRMKVLDCSQKGKMAITCLSQPVSSFDQ